MTKDTVARNGITRYGVSSPLSAQETLEATGDLSEVTGTLTLTPADAQALGIAVNVEFYLNGIKVRAARVDSDGPRFVDVYYRKARS